MSNNRTTYSSRFAAILTLVGVAVGLGNIWRFPYMMGKYGGAAFLFVYLIFMLLFAVPALMAEIALGRAAGDGTLAAFRKVFGRQIGSIVGIILLISLLIAASYYAVVVGTVLFTALFSVFKGFNSETIPVFGNLTRNGWIQYLCAMVLVTAGLYVVHRGLRNGIELISKIVVPFFASVIIYLIFFSLSLPGAVENLTTFLQPNFSLMSFENVFAALGQAFFSVGLGGTFMVAYGVYLDKNESIPKIAISTSLGDLSASLMASLFLVPTILIFGLDIAAGPGLIFDTLPQLFSQLPWGRVTGSLFLVALFSVAFLSMVAAYEVLVGSVTGEIVKKEKGKSRVILIVWGLMALLALPSSLYPDLIGILDMVVGSGMQVFGSLLAVIGVSWGLGKSNAMDEIFGRDGDTRLRDTLHFWLRWVVPAVLIVVLLGYIYSQIA